MKYLKRYNESLKTEEVSKEEITEFCNDYLAYLLDENVHLSINTWNSCIEVNLEIIDKEVQVLENLEGLLLPFIEQLDNTYNLVNKVYRKDVPVDSPFRVFISKGKVYNISYFSFQELQEVFLQDPKSKMAIIEFYVYKTRKDL